MMCRFGAKRLQQIRPGRALHLDAAQSPKHRNWKPVGRDIGSTPIGFAKLRISPQFYAVIKIKREDAKSVAILRIIHDIENRLRHGMNIDGYSIDVKISNFIRHSVASPSAAMQDRWVKHAPPRLLAIPPTSVAAYEA
jgi:hypothetical protein